MFQKIYKSCCLFESKPIRNIVLKINGAEKKSCSKLIIIPLKFYRKEKSPIVDLIEVQPVANYKNIVSLVSTYLHEIYTKKGFQGIVRLCVD